MNQTVTATIPVTPWMSLAILAPANLSLTEVLYGDRAALAQAVESGRVTNFWRCCNVRA